MSHTTRCGETTFIHNGDYDGEVDINRKRPNGAEDVVTVPMDDLIEFVAEYVNARWLAYAESGPHGHRGRETLFRGAPPELRR